MPFTLNESLIVNKESNLACPFTYNESFNEVTLPTFKLLSIFTFPFAKTESDTYNLLLAKMLCSILAPFETIKESLNCKPEFKIKFPLTSKSFPTVKLVSIKTLPFTLKESLIVNKESNLARPFTYNESFNDVTFPTFKLLSIFTFPFAKMESETYNLLFAKILCSFLAPF